VNPALLPILTFVAVVMAITGVYSILTDLYLRDSSRLTQRIDEEFRKRQRERARKALLFKDLYQDSADLAAMSEERPNLRRRFGAMVEQSGLDLTPQKLLTIAGAAGLGLGSLAGLLRQNVAVGVIAALFAAVVPILYVQRKRTSRIEKLLSQLPDAFDLMGRVIRAGQTMSQAMQAVADGFSQPISGEFSYCFEQQNLGLPSEAALRSLAQRTGVLEIRIFVVAVMVQQQTGGNLAELLDKLAALIRQRHRTRGQIKSLTAEGRMQAAVLLGLPIFLFFGMLLLLGDYEYELLKHPRLIVGTLVFEGFGALWIRKIVNFDY
jgi:tight adherence protein B